MGSVTAHRAPGIIDSAFYQPDGQTSNISYANGTSTSLVYDPARRWLDRILHLRGSTTFLRLDYARDAVGRITSVQSSRTGDSWIYTYNELDRLKTADNTTDDTLDENFWYRKDDNLSKRERLGLYTYPAPGPTATRPHAPLSAGNRYYQYDANGNVRCWGSTAGSCTTVYVWDGENRLLAANDTSFVYAPDGTRLKKVTPSDTTLYLGPDIEREGGTYTKYVHPDAVRVGSATTWIHRDHLNSVRLRTGVEITNPDGTVTPAPLWSPPTAWPGAKPSRGSRKNPDDSWSNHGPAKDYTGSGRASGQRGRDRDRRRDRDYD